MSFRTYFSMATGLSEPIIVKPGTLDDIKKQVQETESVLGLIVEQYKNNPKHWENDTPTKEISDKVYCEIAEKHNHFIHWLYNHFAQCSETPFPNGETITPEQIAPYFYGLEQEIKVPISRWTRDYYVYLMEEMYEALRGRGEAYTLDSKSLTERQAADVITLFGQWLDIHDCRPDVPKGHDRIACSDDGGYIWCEKCGAVTEEDASNCTKRKCPVKKEWGEE